MRGRCARGGTAPRPATWSAWISIRNRSGDPGPHVERKVTQEVRLDAADPDDEERTQADRQQHHASLVARTVQPKDGVAHRERSRPRKRRRRSYQRPAGDVQHERNHARSRRIRSPRPATTRPASPRAPRAPHRPAVSRRRAASPGGAARHPAAASSSDGLMWRTRSSGTSEKSSDTVRPMPTAWSIAAGRQGV